MKKTVNDKRESINVGEYIRNNQCRFCFNNKIHKFIDFGFVPLAGGFFEKGSTKKDFNKEYKYPLEIYFCSKCYLVQSPNVISPDKLFKNYFYFSSTISSLVNHFKSFAKHLKRYYRDPKKCKILEIGCNDGVFLKPLKKEGFKVIGVDPAKNVVRPLIKEGFNVINTYFNENTARKIKKLYGKVDVISGTSSLAHIDDMHDVIKGIKLLLRDDGILIFEEHYLGNVVDELQYDMMYHEHPSYYSLHSLKEFLEIFDMHVFNVKPLKLRAGLMRYYIQNRDSGKRKITKNVERLLAKEKKDGLHKYETYKNYFKRINYSKKHLMKLLEDLKKNDYKIVGYGASGRATIIMSFCGIDQKHLDYMVDDSPARQGIFMPGNHMPVRSSVSLDNPKTRPDYALVFAWPFIDEIKKKKSSYLKSGGKFIIPLPEVEIIS
jgi:SAM-dependent methyltransferase